jgi:hypothetical protein
MTNAFSQPPVDLLEPLRALNAPLNDAQLARLGNAARRPGMQTHEGAQTASHFQHYTNVQRWGQSFGPQQRPLWQLPVIHCTVVGCTWPALFLWIDRWLTLGGTFWMRKDTHTMVQMAQAFAEHNKRYHSGHHYAHM